MTYSSKVNNECDGAQWLTCRVQYLDDTDPFSSTNFPEPTRPPSYTFNTDLPLCEQLAGVHRLLKAPHKIGDCTLQLSHTHVYLDLDLSISEQKEEFETFHAEGKRNSIIIRTLLSIRVHSCIEKLYNSKGRELRRALFSLKQVFQDDKDLVHQFVDADGLTCLIQVGAEADQNYQNYILRALGQIMLYIDGMEGVIRHSDTVRWLYFLISSKFRLVVKTTLKLLLVFVEYSESNALVLIDAIRHVDSQRGQPTWGSFMDILSEKDSMDSELLVYTMTLINKTLSNVPDQDTFYDITDALEEQKMDEITQRHLNKRGSDIDLIEQVKIYEMALKHEDGDDDIIDPSTTGSAIKWNRERRKSEVIDQRKSKRRNSVSLASGALAINQDGFKENRQAPALLISNEEAPEKIPDPNISPKPWIQRINSSPVLTTNHRHMAVPVTASIVEEVNEEREKRRRERMAKWSEKEKSYRRQAIPSLEDIYQKERNKLERRRNLLNAEISLKTAQNGLTNGVGNTNENDEDPPLPPPPPTRTSSSQLLEKRRLERKQRQQLQEQVQQKVMEQEKAKQTFTEHPVNGDVTVSRPRRRRYSVTKPSLPNDSSITVAKTENGETHFPSRNGVEAVFNNLSSTTETIVGKKEKNSTQNNSDGPDNVIANDRKLFMDMLYSNQSVASKQTESDENSDETSSVGIETQNGISLNVKGLAEKLQNSNMQSVNEKAKTDETSNNVIQKTANAFPPTVKKDSDVMWEKLVVKENFGFDFSGLSSLDDFDVLSSSTSVSPGEVLPTPVSGVPPPPPPPPLNGVPLPPPPPPLIKNTSPSSPLLGSLKRRTIRLFWKEAVPPTANNFRNKSSVWSEVNAVDVDSDYFINLFLLKSKESLQKKQQNEKRNELSVLEVKRSNAINIGMTILPPPRTIKSAILNMDEFALTKEQIEKLLVMIPTEEEISAIQEAMQSSPDIALGSAEQFLLTLSSISELEARLNLWAFKLEYDFLEKEVAEPLQDLKDGINELKSNKTFRLVLATLRSIGNLLNSTKINGFDISYLSKVPEVKDTVHKQTLLHHLTQCVLEKFPDSSDLYSELGALTRCSRVDFEALEDTLNAMEKRCKNSWDHLKLIAKHESKAAFRSKLPDFLMSCARKIITLKTVHSRLKNRFHAMLLYFGSSPKSARETSIQDFARMISEFALEYRTARERVESQIKKRQQRVRRDKTGGKLIVDHANILSDSFLSDEEIFLTITQNMTKTEEDLKQKQLERIIRPGERSRLNKGRRSEDFGMKSPKSNSMMPPSNDDVTDQIMEQIVKTATQTPRDRTAVVSRRKRSRQAQRKSLRRTLKNGLTDEEKAAIISRR